ncbi:hypothetical protein [Argonema galeatum]|uniref:hypothetical protein n=1 Tax=Argonema galeatum TaxID=2942762 RepID=UPI0020139F71|nr:hypothetical protein [Argonema galeatum]MCL1467616.1 hypothetical protein [Argonema galeatum A003/A1]
MNIKYFPIKKLRQVCAVSIAIASVSSFWIQAPAKANLSFDVRYICITQNYRVETNGSQSGQLKYTAYQGNYRREETPSREPDLVLYNGGAYFQTRNRLVMTWTNSGNYTYQLIVSSPPGRNINYPQSGTLIVKRRGRVTLQQNCRDISTAEVTE